MKVYIQGTGWVTPLGRSVPEVWDKIRRGETAAPETLELGGNRWPYLPVEESLLVDTARIPRLRRSGKISHMALAAAKDAVTSSGFSPEATREMAILFATSDGGVNYTRRFFDGLHLAGTGSGSPLLFPETVYNAPASHIAAHFGSDQEASAIVGDSATGLTALSAAFQLLKSGMANSVLVVAANECDAISAAGYSRWKFLRQSGSDSGHVFSEMAAAIILSLTPSSTCLRWVKEGACFASKTQAENRLKEMLGSPSSASRMISCGSSFMQDCEGENSDSRVNMKPSLGEALAASSLAQVVAAAHWSQSESADVFLSSLGFGGSLAAAEVGPA